ncbi:sigma-70 family RNA polymerase sigma factor [Streptomyces sp. SBT349]|uniref:sigma-70 family RNA polymerase sigma factor n=1 Tax=Streptomyces sp. SBT349 TaxID=1580539 RepID=UPI00131DCD37|nr:sigma-70 family RNA polymerase sigma factor [Streptomyces sp. SBT349]
MSDGDAASSADHSVVSAAAARHDDLGMLTRTRLTIDTEFSEFYRDNIRKLIGFLLNHGAKLPVAADIAQDAMAALYRRWSEIRNPWPWVCTVASRALVRKISEVREDPFEDVPESTSLLPQPDTISEWETQHDVGQMLQRLPPRQRQMLAWTLAGYQPAEIAEQLRMTPEAVRASLMKARRAATAYFSTGKGEK